MAPGSSTWLTVSSTLILNGSTFVLNNAGLIVNSGGLVQDATLIVNSNESPDSAFDVTKFFNDRELQWTQNGDLFVNVRSENASTRALKIRGGITWIQNGDVTINLTSTQASLVGIVLSSTSGTPLVWSQLGDVSITYHGGGSVGAILIHGPYSSFYWNQTGNVAIDITTDVFSASIEGVDSYVAGSATWAQHGNVSVKARCSGAAATVYGIITYDLAVIQTAHVSVDVAAAVAHGIYLGDSWTQNGSMSLSVTGSNATGMNFFISIASWWQYGLASIDMQGSRSKGVDCHSGVWHQYGDLHVLVDGANSCGVDSDGEGIRWFELGAQPDIKVSGAGSIEICGRSASPTPRPSTTGGSTTGTPSGDRSSANGLSPATLMSSTYGMLATLRF